MSRLLQHYLAEQADARPDAVALVMGDERLTYGELEAVSNRLAHHLIEVGCRPGDRVVLLTPKSPAAVIASLATLKAGCAYVPIDTDSPAARVRHIITSAAPRLLLAMPAATSLLDGLAREGVLDGGMLVGSLDDAHLAGDGHASAFARGDWATRDGAAPTVSTTGRDPAHLLFTSGSTGVPKGVVITHDNVTAFVDWANAYLRMGPDDRWSGHPPLHFDLSTYDIFGTLASGGQLHLMPARLNLLPHKLADFIRRSELTRWFSVPSTLTFMTSFEVIARDDFPALRHLLWCGEVLPTAVLRDLMARLPHVAFTNLYGPTEATIASSYHTVPRPPDDDTASIPIGVACDGEELVILDDDRHPVGVDEVGQLHIGGVGLSPGYWRDRTRTAEAFIADPRASAPDAVAERGAACDAVAEPGAASGARLYRTGDLARRDADGLVHFLGRADSQIKHRGYRIELGEIEAALNALGVIRECAVVGVPTDGFEGTAICCAYAAETHDVDVASLRTALRERLPSYMVPGQWRAWAQLPRNANGKLDRRALADGFAADLAQTRS